MYGIVDYQTIWDTSLDQMAVWRDILNPSISLYQLTTNPFRPDSHPNCYLRDYNGLILFTDFAYPKYSKYTCIHAVADIYQCSLNEAALYVHNIYNLHAGTLHSAHPRQQTKLSNVKAPSSKGQIHFEPFTKNGKAVYTELDKEYWQKRFVSSEQLRRLNVFSVKQFWVNAQPIHPVHPTYAYYFPQTAHVKLYTPATKKFFGTVTTEDVWKISRNSNVCVITKSAKDLLVLENILPDYDIHSFQSEAVVPDLSEYNNYDRVIILYDNDATGIEKSKNLRQLMPIAVDFTISPHLGVKDPDEMIVQYGFNFTNNYINNLINGTDETGTHGRQLVGALTLDFPDAQ